MTKLNKVNDTTPNLNLLKSQLISITSNVQISVNSQLIVLKHLNFDSTSNKTKSQLLNYFKCSNFSQFSTDFVSPSPPSSTIIGPLQMLISQSILNQFCSNFGLYVSRPILTKYIISHRISINPITLNLKISLLQMLLSLPILN